MRVVIQRVLNAAVSVNDSTISQIGKGIAVLVGISQTDTQADADKICRKLLSIRLWPQIDKTCNSNEHKSSENGHEEKELKPWSTNVKENNYEVLCVSQFTLNAVLKGNKPDFHYAMHPSKAQEIYNKFIADMKKNYKPEMIKDGEFGAHMHVSLCNDGPVTIILDTDDDKKDAEIGKIKTDLNNEKTKNQEEIRKLKLLLEAQSLQISSKNAAGENTNTSSTSTSLTPN
jgi:D-tyrosyl-tRNA(Tyr) deacylase